MYFSIIQQIVILTLCKHVVIGLKEKGMNGVDLFRSVTGMNGGRQTNIITLLETTKTKDVIIININLMTMDHGSGRLSTALAERPKKWTSTLLNPKENPKHCVQRITFATVSIII